MNSMPAQAPKKTKKKTKSPIVSADLIMPVYNPADDIPFCLDSYLIKLEEYIKSKLLKPKSTDISYDILDTEKTKQKKLIALGERQRMMMIGDIWQYVFGNYGSFKDLGSKGHVTGLDILSLKRKIICEVKNRTDTVNSGSLKTVLDKLASFKKANPDYTVIFGNINDAKKAKDEEAQKKNTMEGKIKIITHDGLEIHHYIGMRFIQLILGDDADRIIDFIKTTIDKYTI